MEWVDDLGDNYGESDHEAASIEIVEGLDSHLDREILRQQGRHYCKAEEEYVTALACGLIPVLDANPHLRKYLKA